MRLLSSNIHLSLAAIVIGSIVGGYWQYMKEPYGIMAVIAGSVVGTIAFFIVSVIERAMGKPPAPPVMPES